MLHMRIHEQNGSPGWLIKEQAFVMGIQALTEQLLEYALQVMVGVKKGLTVGYV